MNATEFRSKIYRLMTGVLNMVQLDHRVCDMANAMTRKNGNVEIITFALRGGQIVPLKELEAMVEYPAPKRSKERKGKKRK